ncbi:MAG: hypothetical protein SFX73_08515 [Kofleriaceae bacterium]|nr:hypothetical protein [Kofleriaceae bacterium]
MPKKSNSKAPKHRGKSSSQVEPSVRRRKVDLAGKKGKELAQPSVTVAASAEAPTGAPKGAVRDGRLPPVGTSLVKRDRRGAARCECVVEDGGIRYSGVLYPSLSAAASAAAKDLGLKMQVNGFTFWGIVKPNRPALRPAERLRRLGERYEEQAREVISAQPDGLDPGVRDEIEKHAALVQRIIANRAA